LGLIVLVRRNDLDASEIIASIVMFGIAIGLAFFLYLGARSADKLGRVLAWIARLINRIAHPFIHREYLKEARAYTFAHEMAESLSNLPQRWQSLIYPLLWSIANKALMMAILIACFLSFSVPFSAGTIIGGFSISYLFLVVSPTPSGIGVVEGIMALALDSLNVVWSQAVVITLAYRAITFWVPLGVGALVFRSLHMNVEEK
jgi:glycosyltransferase 2 family protein